MSRSPLAFFLVLAVLPLAAADVPLSDRPLAPLAVNTIAASASPDAVLIVFSDGADLYAQRLRPDGSPLDPTAFFLARAPHARTVWDGERWLVFFGGSPVHLIRIDPSGTIDGPHPLDLGPYFDVAFAGGRTLIGVHEWISGATAHVSVYEAGEGSTLRPTGLTVPLDDPRAIWPAAVNGSPALVTQKWLWGTDPFRSAVFTVTTASQSTDLVVPVPSGASNVSFVPSRASGGLFLWNDGGMRGAILRADGTISPAFSIGPAATVREGILASPRDGGYDVLFQTLTETWIARVAETGVVDARPLAGTFASIGMYSHALVPSGELDLLVSARFTPARGVEVRRIEGSRVDEPSIVGIGEAAQSAPRAASGAGLDLVTWIEQGFDGLLLKAGRVVDGIPLDGAGIVLANEGLFDSSRWRSTAHEVAFDGEAFVVVWLERPASGPRLVTRRIFPDGSVSERVILAAWQGIGDELDVVGIGGGRSAVSWIGTEAPSSGGRSVLVLLDRGVPRTPTEVASGTLGYSLPRLAVSGDRILAVFNDYTECRILCESNSRPYGRMFTLDGVPLGEARLLSSNVGEVPQAVSDGQDFFVVWRQTLVRIRPDFSIGPEVELARGGDLSIQDGELLIDHGITRAVYSLSGTLLRFEPRGVPRGETVAAQLSRDRIVVSVPAHPARLMIRSLSDVLARTADLAVVATGTTPSASDYSNATFRVEHRGGDPVRRIELWGNSGIIVPDDPYASSYRLLDRELREGESFEVIVRFYPGSPAWGEPRLWVAGDAVDLIPANNTGIYQRPTRSRGRTVGR